jgi:hypothetical protein
LYQIALCRPLLLFLRFFDDGFRCPEGAWRDQKQNPLEEKEKNQTYLLGAAQT